MNTTPVMQRELVSLAGNSQKLDGGAMFGNAPRAVWETWAAPDAHNRIDLACRCLLVRDTFADGSVRNVLLETGVGAFFAPKLRQRYGVQESLHVLLQSLAEAGLAPGDIDVIVLSHLHFDHAGGLLASWQADKPASLAFPRARILVGRKAFERAKSPHVRDRASFIAELPALLEASGRLSLVEGAHSPVLGNSFRFHFSDGHTPGLLMTEINLPREQGGGVLFPSDLIPGAPWVHLPVTMGYDRYPELLVDEKSLLLAKCVQRGIRLFFTHDPRIAIAKVVLEDGRYRAVPDALS
jgi:glyoxylase-like metal-dependent hydrolase (beta-lactamase superfamily II)